MNALLWTFTQLPDNYLVLDMETTGLPDEEGLPDIVSLGFTKVRKKKVTQTIEFKIRPTRRISESARSIHGMTNEQAARFRTLEAQWQVIAEHLDAQLIVIHNAGFDWPILADQMSRSRLMIPDVQGVFCSQKAAIPWAQAKDLAQSTRGPSLDTLASCLGVVNLRSGNSGLHGAGIDSRQTAYVVEALRQLASIPEDQHRF